jgi:hypothetical protein
MSITGDITVTLLSITLIGAGVILPSIIIRKSLIARRMKKLARALARTLCSRLPLSKLGAHVSWYL